MSKINAPSSAQPLRNTIAERERALGLPGLPPTLGAAKMHPTRVQYAQGYFVQRGKLMTDYYAQLHALPADAGKCRAIAQRIANLDAVMKTESKPIELKPIVIFARDDFEP